MNIREEKNALRQVMRYRRREAHAADPYAAIKMRDVFLENFDFPASCIIGFYSPIEDEMDPLPLVTALAERGHELCMPVIVAPREPLLFRAYTPGDSLAPGMFRVNEPLPSQEILEPSVLLLPMLAFDRRGYRLGYGGGYFDRTINRLRQEQKSVCTMGLSYAAQEVAQVPVGRYDLCLDAIITEVDTCLPSRNDPIANIACNL